jgi:hypothetical protein
LNRWLCWGWRWQGYSILREGRRIWRKRTRSGQCGRCLRSCRRTLGRNCSDYTRRWLAIGCKYVGLLGRASRWNARGCRSIRRERDWHLHRHDDNRLSGAESFVRKGRLLRLNHGCVRWLGVIPCPEHQARFGRAATRGVFGPDSRITEDALAMAACSRA